MYTDVLVINRGIIFFHTVLGVTKQAYIVDGDWCSEKETQRWDFFME